MSAANPGDDPVYDDWPVKEEDPDDVEWVGNHDVHGIMLYRHSTSSLFAAEPNEEEGVLERVRGTEREVEGTLGETLEEMGEERDWEWLSEFAREHLEGSREDER